MNYFIDASALVRVTRRQLSNTYLHEDKDFETAARLIPIVHQHRISEPPPDDAS